MHTPFSQLPTDFLPQGQAAHAKGTMSKPALRKLGFTIPPGPDRTRMGMPTRICGKFLIYFRDRENTTLPPK
jgi:hypothetical protein